MTARASLLALFLLAAGALHLSAQDALDPNAGMYSYIDSWTDRGLVRNPPLLRPYSPDLLERLLQEVRDKGNAADRERATDLMRSLDLTRFQGSAETVNQLRDGEYAARHGFNLSAAARLSREAAVSGNLGLWLNDGFAADVLPPTERPPVDLAEDNIFHFNVLGRSLGYRINTTSAISVGSGTLSLQAGITRASFGPFFSNGVVIGPQAPVTPNVIFNWWSDLLSFSEGFFTLSDRTSWGSLSADKFMVIHAIQLSPWSTVDLAAFESIVWKGAFAPLYLMPAADLFYAQSLNGFADNSLIGISGSVRFSPGLSVKSIVYFDDMFKFAGQIGASWSPKAGWLRMISLDYTAVLPYTYTHQSSEGNDYSQWGQNFGPALDPNSDRLEVRAAFSTIPGFDLHAEGRLVRHGNASEGIPGGGDGSVFDSGYVNGSPTFQSDIPQVLRDGLNLRFLTQSVLDTSLQLGLGGSLSLALGWGILYLDARYLFEYRWNERLISGNNNFHNYLSLQARLSLFSTREL